MPRTSQTPQASVEDPDGRDDFRLSIDALNCHRVEWRLREEWGSVDGGVLDRIRSKVCLKRGYEPEEFAAAMVATRDRPRLPFGWTALDRAARRLQTRPIRLMDENLDSSRYAKGVIGLAVHLQTLQKEEPILLPVEQVRAILAAKKVVVAETITRLVELGLLEMTKSTYHTGSARELRFKGVEGKDYVFILRDGADAAGRT